ncbi:MAG: hypothetical protein IJP06_04210 [Agathobacter sp.]|nr:hypothetical protein [Agathobacter sp.]
MDLISIIILCVVIARVFKKNSPEKYEETVRKAKELGNEVVGELRGNMESKRATYEQQRRNFEQQTQPRRAKQTTRTTPAYEQINMQDYQKRQSADTARKARTVQPTSTVMEENDEARQQIYKSRMEAKNTTILQRARANADEDKEDVTLRSLEESHGHSAHVAPAVHNHPEDVIPENSLKKIEDLMVKGYEADLCFERDFVGEAMDMVNRFSMGGSV